MIIAGGEPVPVATRPGLTRRGDRGGARALIAQAEGPHRQLPAQPDQRRRRAGVLREGGGAGQARVAVGDLGPRLRGSGPRRAPRAQHLRGAGRARAGGRGLHRLEELLDAGLAGRILRRQPDAGRRARDNQGLPRLRHVRPDAARGGDRALAACDADVAVNRERYKHRTALLVDGLAKAGWPVPCPPPRCSCGRPCRRARREGMGAVEFAAELLEEARVAVAPGVGFGPGGEGYVRFALVETDERARAGLCRNRRLSSPACSDPPETVIKCWVAWTLAEPIRTAVIGAGQWGPNLIRHFDSPPASVVKSGRRSRRRAAQAGAAAASRSVAVDEDAAIVVQRSGDRRGGHRHADQQPLRAGEGGTRGGQARLVRKADHHPRRRGRGAGRLAERRRRVLMVGHVFIFNLAVQRVSQLHRGGRSGARLLRVDGPDQPRPDPRRRERGMGPDVARHQYREFLGWAPQPRRRRRWAGPGSTLVARTPSSRRCVTRATCWSTCTRPG